MEKNEIVHLVEEAATKKIKNSICHYCGNDSKIFIGEGTKVQILNINNPAWIEELAVTVACSNCGHITSFLPKFLFGEEQYKVFIEKVAKSLENNNISEKENNSQGE